MSRLARFAQSDKYLMNNSGIRKFLCIVESAQVAPEFRCSCCQPLTEWAETLTGLGQTFSIGGTQISIVGNGTVTVNGQNYGGTSSRGVAAKPHADKQIIAKPDERRDVGKPDKPDERRDVGNTELVYYEHVSPQVRDQLELAVSEARRWMGAKNLLWIMDTQIIIKTDPKWPGWYDAQTDSLRINPGQSTSVLVPLIVHEFGHRFHNHGCPQGVGTDIDIEIADKYSYCMSNDRSAFVSNYSRTNRNEFWAEHFAGWVMGSMPGNRLNSWIEETVAKYNR